MIVSSAEVSKLVTDIFLHEGASLSNAECVAEHLVSANLSGVDSHGVWHVPGYVAAIRRKEIVPGASPAVLTESPASLLVTGHWTFGQVATEYALDLVLKKAQHAGIAVASIVQAYHVGRLGDYAETAAEHGMIAMVWAAGLAEVRPAVVPYGGSKRVFGTNPLAMGFPAGKQPRVMFDFATSAAAGVKVINAHRHGTSVPEGWIVDKNGNPTTDPRAWADGGGAVPFGGHKGYALMVATEILGHVFAGSDAHVETGRGGPDFDHHAATVIVLKPDLFQPIQNYRDTMDKMVERIRAVPPAPSFKEVLVPGDPEVRARAVRQREGIPIPDDLWKQLTELAQASPQHTRQTSG
jgi:LDH2 family malate/lactate/ureidoglycolate dehydrogenase